MSSDVTRKLVYYLVHVACGRQQPTPGSSPAATGCRRQANVPQAAADATEASSASSFEVMSHAILQICKVKKTCIENLFNFLGCC